MRIALAAFGIPTVIAVVIVTALTTPPFNRPTRSTAMEPEQFTEYAVRVTLPGYQPRIRECARFLRDAQRAYHHEVLLHGPAAVQFLNRLVTRTDWVAGTLPPPPDDGGICDPSPAPGKPTVTAGGIDTWQEPTLTSGPDSVLVTDAVLRGEI